MTYIQVTSLFFSAYQFYLSGFTDLLVLGAHQVDALVMPKSFGLRTISDSHNLDEYSG